jgi:uncharacterized RDD family membrane protein YckC
MSTTMSDTPTLLVGLDGKQLGPFTRRQVQDMLDSGRFSPDDIYWEKGMSGWAPLRDAFSADTPPPMPEHRNTGASPRTTDTGRYPSGLRSLSERIPPEAAAFGTQRHAHPHSAISPYAGFWRRFAALLIDAIICGCITLPIVLILISVTGDGDAGAIVGNLISSLIEWLYYALSESSQHQATLGKRALGIIVTECNGGRISFATATGRLFGKALSMLIFFFGFFMCGWTKKKQTLHDIMAGCLVVKK